MSGFGTDVLTGGGANGGAFAGAESRGIAGAAGGAGTGGITCLISHLPPKHNCVYGCPTFSGAKAR